MNIKRSNFVAPVECVNKLMFADNAEEVTCNVDVLCAIDKNLFETQICFVFGKAKIASMKALSISNFELQAALLATH